jgi:zinc protease
MFGCAPQNVDKLISSVQDEINKLKNSGPAENNLEKFKAEAGRSLEIEQQSNEFWLDYLTSQLQNKEGINQIEDYPAAVQHITVDDIRQSADLYLSGKNFIKLVLLPEKGQGE